jgi:ABC-2 type transport system ATP-binding protein
MVVSTPYMDEAERCNRVGLLFKGALVECGTPNQVKARVQGDLIELRPEPMDRAQEILRDLAGVLELQVYGDLLHVFVDEQAQRLPQVQAALAAAGVRVERVRAIQPRMEEAFISLIRRQSELGGGGERETSNVMEAVRDV